MKFTGKRINNIYMIDLDDPILDSLCLTVSKEDSTWLWHRRLGHASYNVMHKFGKFNMVRDLPDISLKRTINFVSLIHRKSKLENLITL